MRRLARLLVLACGASACTLVTDLEGLSAVGTDSGTMGIEAGLDAAPGDALADAPPMIDSGGDGSSDAEAGAPCGSAGPTAGLLAYYPFDEGMGDVVRDCGPNHIDGAFVSQAAGGSWAAGKKGGAIRAQAANGCVDLGTPAKLQSPTMTVTAWVQVSGYPAAGASGYVIGQTVNADVTGWRIGTRSTGVLSWEHSVSGTTYQIDSTSVGVGAWHHVAFAFAPDDKLEIFLDGASVKVQAALPAIAFTAVSMRIGCRADNANYFNGLIDEVRLYDRILTPAEITTLAAP